MIQNIHLTTEIQELWNQIHFSPTFNKSSLEVFVKQGNLMELTLALCSSIQEILPADRPFVLRLIMAVLSPLEVSQQSNGLSALISALKQVKNLTLNDFQELDRLVAIFPQFAMQLSEFICQASNVPKKSLKQLFSRS